MINGPRVEQFEDAIEDYLNVPHAESVTSCTAGLHLILLALGIGPGDEVITPAFGFPADATMIKMVGAKPVFVDVDPHHHTIDPQHVRQAITERTKAVIAVDYCGLSCKLDELVAIANNQELHIIQDAATSFGGSYKGNRIGNYENVTTVLSFGPIKMITTAGMGGMICTHDDQLAEKLPSLKSYGMDQPSFERQEREKPWYYEVNNLGHNYRMTDIGASMGLAQLKKMPDFLQKRRELAQCYTENLDDIKGLTTPIEPTGFQRAYLYYSIKLDHDQFPMSRDAFALELHDRGVGVSVHWAVPLYLQEVFEELEHNRGDFPVTDRLAEEVLSLPLYPDLEQDDIMTIIDRMKSILSEARTGV